MSHKSDALAEMYRTNRHIKPIHTNKITQARLKQHDSIKEATSGDATQELDYSMQIIKDNLPIIQRYILSQNETPASKLSDLVEQTYQLRCNQINSVAASMDIPQHEAEIWQEMDESEDMELEVSGTDGYLGSIMAAIGIANSRIKQKKIKPLAYDPDYSEPDTLDPQQAGGVIQGLTQAVGSMLTGSELRRAASNKPAGVVGALSTGGTQHYDALREYFRQNPSVAKQVLNGTITSEAQLPNWSSGLGYGANMLNSNEIANTVAQYQTRQMLGKYLPFIIGAVVLIILIIVIAKKK